MAWRRELYQRFCKEVPGIEDITADQIRDFLSQEKTEAIESDLFFEAMVCNHLVNMRRLRVTVREMMKERTRQEKDVITRTILEVETEAIEELAREQLKDLH